MKEFYRLYDLRLGGILRLGSDEINAGRLGDAITVSRSHE